MDDIVVRPRYPRYKTYKRKKKYNRNSYDLSQKIALQVVVCLIILAVSGIVKYVESPFTNFLKDKITEVMSQDIELKEVYGSIDTFLSSLSGSNKKNKADDAVLKEVTLPASTQDEAYLGEEYANGSGTASAAGEGTQESKGDSVLNNTEKKTSRSDSSPIEPIALPAGVKLIVPVAGPIGSPFGERIHPIKKEEIFHKGVDIEANKGEPIKAVMDGEIIEAGSDKTYGNYIKISHSGGWSSVYAHCSILVSRKGQAVKQGDVIAKVGSTGAAVGAHLHFELWKDGSPVDPQLYISFPVKN